MCLKDLKLQQKAHQISKKCLEANFRGCLSQVQQVTIRNKKNFTFPGYLSIDTKKIIKFYKQITEKKSLP